MSTRAKLYCSSLNLSVFNPTEDYTTSPANGKAIFTPVYSPKPDSENKAFWDATPCGSLVLGVAGDDAKKFELGSFWYADVIEDETGDVELKVATKTGDEDLESTTWGQLYVELIRSEDWMSNHVKLTMSISNKKAWPSFDRPLGTRYRIVMSPATKSGS